MNVAYFYTTKGPGVEDVEVASTKELEKDMKVSIEGRIFIVQSIVLNDKGLRDVHLIIDTNENVVPLMLVNY